MFGYLDKKFDAIQNQIDQKYSKSLKKRAIHNHYSFKSNGNSLQFKFNSGLQDEIEDILNEHNLHESTNEALNTNVSITSKRNKVLKIANHYLVGWGTVAEHEVSPFTNDWEDSANWK